MKERSLVGKHIHFIGIGGSGLSSIAVLLMERGVLVSGSDQQESAIMQRLMDIGLDVKIGHRPENVAGAEIVVRSSAVQDENIEVQSALKAGIPVLKREAFLPLLIGPRETIAIAGTHGKTTTTALIAHILRRMHLDPSYVIGGYSPNLGGSAHAGVDELFVIEADEYDRMFLGLTPKIAVVTNVEHDHPDCYPTETDFKQAFSAFANRIVSGGALLACEDDRGSAELLGMAASSSIKTFGYSIENHTADFSADKIEPNFSGGCSFSFLIGGKTMVEKVELQVPGRHNVSNALAALGVMYILDLPLVDAAFHCQTFLGTGRRFEIRGEPNQIVLIDDYAHHPTEIKATIAAARMNYPNRRIKVVWQPHTYSRTQTLLADYEKAFTGADQLIVTEVFAARENQPEDGFSGKVLVDHLIKNAGPISMDIHFIAELSSTAEYLRDSLVPGDVLLVLSAGNANWINSYLLEAFAGLEKT